MAHSLPNEWDVLDASGMKQLVERWPTDWREAWDLAAPVENWPLVQPDAIVVLGMGGSAIGGDLMRAFVAPTSRVPVYVNRSYTVPAFVGPNTLVIASSYSGNTEETLNAFRQARGREAQAVCITSGGQLLEEATKADLPHLKIPGGRPPRAALAFSLAPLLRLSNALGLVPIEPAHVDETIGILSALTAQYQTGTAHLAFDIARRLAGQLPVVYTAPDLLETVGVRWRGQMQENGKSPAYGNVFPELNHNEIVGWEHGLMEQMTVVVLRDQNDHPRVLRRIDVTRALVSERAADWIEVESMGESRMARLLSMICLGDWVSLYLALHNGADPTPIPLIDALKDTLSRS